MTCMKRNYYNTPLHTNRLLLSLPDDTAVRTNDIFLVSLTAGDQIQLFRGI
jgi:hypothetical protein